VQGVRRYDQANERALQNEAHSPSLGMSEGRARRVNRSNFWKLARFPESVRCLYNLYSRVIYIRADRLFQCKSVILNPANPLAGAREDVIIVKTTIK
jgi:hypothetical protein